MKAALDKSMGKWVAKMATRVPETAAMLEGGWGGGGFFPCHCTVSGMVTPLFAPIGEKKTCSGAWRDGQPARIRAESKNSFLIHNARVRNCRPPARSKAGLVKLPRGSLLLAPLLRCPWRSRRGEKERQGMDRDKRAEKKEEEYWALWSSEMCDLLCQRQTWTGVKGLPFSRKRRRLQCNSGPVSPGGRAIPDGFEWTTFLTQRTSEC